VCGIGGLFTAAPLGDALATAVPAQLSAMGAALSHRGPDGQGRWWGGHAGLCHARLAIIDLATGQQPMVSQAEAGRTHSGGAGPGGAGPGGPDGATVLVFNGEIYNYRALRDGLARGGYPFRTQSDTEVILALYERDGIDAFAQLRGMYAVGLWDGRRRMGVLARDGLGIKPLFYQETPAALYFASEAKAILAATGAGATLDESSLHLLLNFRYLPGGRSLFRGIRQLAPGEVLSFQPGAEGAAGAARVTRARRFLQPPPPPGPLLPVLRDSVQAHLTADVEVATYLSGGLDSATVTALARESVPDLHTFTLAVGDDPREAEYAAETARLLGVRNSQAAPTVDLASALPRLLWHLELPKINALQVGLVARLAAGQVKVALSGLGGDELFYGYRAHGIMAQAARVAALAPQALTRTAGHCAAALAAAVGPPWGEPERAARMLAALGDWPRVYGLLRNVWDSPGLRRRIYGERMLDLALPDAFDELRGLWPNEPDPVAAMARYEWEQKMVNDLLWQEDRVSMAVGLEVRVPFVDAHLHAWAQHQGRAALMPGGEKKGLFRREIAALLPATVLTRPKSGFQIDSPAFFHAELQGLAAEYLSPERCRAHGLFNPAFVAAIRRQPPRRGLRWHYFLLFFMLLTHMWLEVFPQHPGIAAPP
jgi:asparagine synthase (glutamine-hydrolysing)